MVEPIIDDFQAWKLANAAIALADSEPPDVEPKPEKASVGNPKGRKRTIERLSSFYACSQRSIGAITNKDYTIAKVAHYGVIETGPAPSLAIFIHYLRFYQDNGLIRIEEDAHKIIAGVEAHALQRLAKRNGVRDLPSFLETLKPIWGWCDAAKEISLKGNFLVPVRDGFICCKREPAPLVWENPSDYEKLGRPTDIDGPPLEESDYIVRVSTFLSFDTMRKDYHIAWQSWTDGGVFDAVPKFPRLRPITEVQRNFLDKMRHEGVKWEERKATTASKLGK